jgi:hypothetical protein
MWGMRKAYQNLVEKPQWKKPLENTKCTGVDDIKTYLTETGGEQMET